MCSVQDEGDTVPTPKPPTIKVEACKKCGDKEVVYTKIRDAYCRDCFVTYCVHKLRSAFGKSKVVRDGENVLLAFSGGPSSTALQHLIQEAKSERTQRKLRFAPALVFIDESAMLDESCENETWKIVEKMRSTALTCYFYRIEQVFDKELKEQSLPSSLEDHMAALSIGDVTENREKLKRLFTEATTLTARENLFHALRSELLLRIAGSVGYSKVVVGDCGTRLSIRLLANITQGRGMHTPLNMGFHDNRHAEVSFLRPMREFSSEEISIYNSIHSLEPTILPPLPNKDVRGPSLERVTETFVMGLQADYPNTCSTIFRTGEKMAMSEKPSSTNASCSLCHAPLDTSPDDVCSAMAAIAFSQLLSTQPAANQSAGNRVTAASTNQSAGNQVTAALTNQSAGNRVTAASTNQSAGNECNGGCCESDTVDGGKQGKEESACCGEGDGSCKSSKQTNRVSREELWESICYGCRLVVKDMNDISTLPPQVLEQAARNKRRKEMKASIQEFLLDD